MTDKAMTELISSTDKLVYFCVSNQTEQEISSFSLGTGFDLLGFPQMAATPSWLVPEMVNSFFPLYQQQNQQLRRPINQQLSVNATVSPPSSVI